ncbi:hypothetical protein BpHYR1_043155 [Brachionus plicatilis]|uniref:Uncharacterized protein n=1 Tax=Brachionus plicatilis TaxID=10195 RepID=A0A3M7RP30_BRAPC|nr:hypothetical protein BpHYR1_043155 [Brachionus plicatilis]
MSNCGKLLHQRIETLEKESITQKDTIKTLSTLVDSLSNTRDRPSQTFSSSTPPMNWSRIAYGMVHRDENAVAIMATIATEMKKKEERA